VQCGTARTIYEEPETRFVAEFIGRSLWFTGKLSEPELSRPATFLCDDGNVLIVSSATVPSVRQGVSVRPEHIHLSPQPGDTNQIAAHVERIEFFGPESNVHCKLETCGRTISIPIRTDQTLLPAIGDRITLGIAPKWCRLVSDA
jgi:putative spermidine/putrescine transport system ATP-binding protein